MNPEADELQTEHMQLISSQNPILIHLVVVNKVLAGTVPYLCSSKGMNIFY